MASRFSFGRVARYLALGISSLGIAAILFGLYVAVRPLDSLGNADENCIRKDFPAVPNKAGLVATAHAAYCGYFIAHGDDTTYVYVHELGEEDSKKSLAFRFDNIHGVQPPLELTWSTPSTLQISVAEVGEITKQLNSLYSTQILYSIGREDTPAGESSRIAMRIAGVLFVLLGVLTAMFVLTVRSIRKQRDSAPIG